MIQFITYSLTLASFHGFSIFLFLLGLLVSIIVLLSRIFHRSPPPSHVLKLCIHIRVHSGKERSREEEKKSVDACGEGEAANTRIFIYANGIRN